MSCPLALVICKRQPLDLQAIAVGFSQVSLQVTCLSAFGGRCMHVMHQTLHVYQLCVTRPGNMSKYWGQKKCNMPKKGFKIG